MTTPEPRPQLDGTQGEPPRDAVEVRLTTYSAPVADDDVHAAFKRAVQDSGLSDPLPTFQELSQLTGVPVGALLRYALVRWAVEGSEALLALGPRAVERLAGIVATAEADGSDVARLQAYQQLRQQLSWLRAALDAE